LNKWMDEMDIERKEREGERYSGEKRAWEEER
jgi:hypothetical protein